MERIPRRADRSGTASVSTLVTSNRPALRCATCATCGATIRHGPHHSAQKSTSTGKRDDPTRASKSAAEGTATGSPGGASTVWQRPQRVDCPSVENVSRLAAPHDGQVTTSPRASIRMLDIADLLSEPSLAGRSQHCNKVRDSRLGILTAFGLGPSAFGKASRSPRASLRPRGWCRRFFGGRWGLLPGLLPAWEATHQRATHTSTRCRWPGSCLWNGCSPARRANSV